MNYNKLNNTWKQLLSPKTSRFAYWKNWFSQKKWEEAQNQKRPDEAQAERNEDLYFRDPEDILQLRDEADGEKALRDLLYPVDPSDSNEEWIDNHQDYIEESSEEESRCMNAFEDDLCDAMADH